MQLQIICSVVPCYSILSRRECSYFRETYFRCAAVSEKRLFEPGLGRVVRICKLSHQEKVKKISSLVVENWENYVLSNKASFDPTREAHFFEGTPVHEALRNRKVDQLLPGENFPE